MAQTSLALPDRNAPTNLRLRDTIRARFVEGDLLDIARQLAERHPSLYALELTDPTVEPGKAVWAIMEDCEDGVQRVLFKVPDLDQRVLQRMDRIMSKPLAERIAECERENHVYEAEAHEAELDRLYENVGKPMWKSLEDCGFIQRPVSYAKKGISYKTLDA